MNEIQADTPLTENSTVRIRANVLRPLVEQSRAEQTQQPNEPVHHEPERSEFDNRARKVWHSRLGAWLREHLSMATQSCFDRALDRTGKEAYRRVIEARDRKLREAHEAGERALQAAVADARESHVTATQHCNTSHAFILQRLIGDAQRLGRVVNKKFREGRLKHTESTLVDEEYFMTDEWLSYLEFEVRGGESS